MSAAGIAALCFALLLGRPAYSQEIAVSNPSASPIEPARQTFEEEPWARERAAKIAAQLADRSLLSQTKVLFVGDSITEFWTTHGEEQWRHFAQSQEFRSLNVGFAGDRTENLLYHLLESDEGGEGFLEDPALDPDVIVLLIGINNTWNTDGQIVEEVVAGNIAIIARLRQLRPQATIIVQSLLPAGDSERSQNLVRPINRQLALQIEGFGPKVRWLDLFPAFALEDGGPVPELFVDTVHPSAAGYEVWRPMLLDALQDVASHESHGTSASPE